MRSVKVFPLIAVVAALIVSVPGLAKTRTEQILDKGVLRCAYIPYSVGLKKDPNTGALSGVAYDVMNRAGEMLGIKVEWTEEVAWGTMIEGVLSNRYDAVCSGVWQNATRAKFVSFSQPLYYSAVGVWVKADDARFSEDVRKLNTPDVRLMTMDGEMSSIIAKTDFARAKTVALPQTVQVSELLTGVKDGKADATFAEIEVGASFLKNNPGSVKNIAGAAPIRVFPNVVILPPNEPRLKEILDVAIQEQLNSGEVSRIFKKHGVTSDMMLLPAGQFATR